MEWVSYPVGAAVGLGDAESLLLDGLAARAARGEQTAFSEIYSLLTDSLYAYARGQCGDASAAEDVVANVFLKAWRSAKSYRCESRAYRRWIFTIARNEVRTYWRANLRDRHAATVLPDDIAEPLTDDGIDPEEVRRVVVPAMATLTDAQREVVVLRYFANMSYEEVARVTGKQEGAVRALILRALRRMRRELAHAAH